MAKVNSHSKNVAYILSLIFSMILIRNRFIFYIMAFKCDDLSAQYIAEVSIYLYMYLYISIYFVFIYISMKIEAALSSYIYET